MPYNHPQVITIQKGVDGPVPGREDMTIWASLKMVHSLN